MTDDQVIELCSAVLGAMLNGNGVSYDDVRLAHHACLESIDRLQALKNYSLLAAEPLNRMPL